MNWTQTVDDVAEHYASLSLVPGFRDYCRAKVREIEADSSGYWVGLLGLVRTKIDAKKATRHAVLAVRTGDAAPGQADATGTDRPKVPEKNAGASQAQAQTTVKPGGAAVLPHAGNVRGGGL